MIHLGTDIAARNFCMTAVARCFRTFIKPLIFRPKFMSSRSSSHITYQWQEGVENLEGYSAGGFHPVKIGDEFRQARYRVVHKLGYGGSSTAWLVRDSALNRYVCLKILAANSSDSDAEQRVWKAMHDPRVFDPGRKFVSFSIDQFELQGPNGNHTCLVKEVLGPTLSDVKNFFAHEFIPLHIARKATVQLALGLAYIHSRGIIHGGMYIISWRIGRKSSSFSSQTLRRSSQKCCTSELWWGIWHIRSSICGFGGSSKEPHLSIRWEAPGPRNTTLRRLTRNLFGINAFKWRYFHFRFWCRFIACWPWIPPTMSRAAHL